jgi:hypothetical protein
MSAQTKNYDLIPEVHVRNTTLVSWPPETKPEEVKTEQGEPIFGSRITEVAKVIRKMIGK